MLKIRLQRVGRKHDPSYRVVATNSRTGPKSNKHVAVLGHYDAIRKTKTFDADAIKEWMAKGAQLSDTVHNLLVKEGIIKGDTVNALPKKTAPVVEASEEAPAEDESANTEAPAEESSDEPAEAEAPAEEKAEAAEEKKEEEPSV